MHGDDDGDDDKEEKREGCRADQVEINEAQSSSAPSEDRTHPSLAPPLLPCPQPRMYDAEEDGEEEKSEGFDRSSENQRSTEECCSSATSAEDGNDDDIDSEQDRPFRILAQSRHD
ncbi:hypothetical protein PF005_g8615 [Phytophthora fragariae]|uniref:Uncharacterized protein n=1 Tax=Phytophthora fragariae TaxID=53985 RepID=A0A6A3EQ69_9STRA|nr:hypothetical protein PF003_g18522 [Phytophthora fragariae]KAE8935632.1 hypothetical protein PF009_g14425 [Phytophthora fragariae]KAE9000745.1 hypothetical protein PF011_g14053 [Phytophthora fragariae]KAE9102943.1 hypothetical protein PF007_g14567 [Phytophthora fragariae]KAE9142629.1 hypothetical protein PF006_g12272 [Phytophthora fragariae]